ncbi:hypothetical protein BAME_06760 [Bacillus sp. M 2-6]|nr:hypothetical protein BAME_06760 [Bacillus sp. M 2-6]
MRQSQQTFFDIYGVHLLLSSSVLLVKVKKTPVNDRSF